MLINLSKHLSRMAKPLLLFWLFCSSMMLCAISTSSPPGSLSDSQQPLSAGQQLPERDHSFVHSAESVKSPRLHQVHRHHHGMTDDASSQHSHGNNVHHDSHDHGGECCGEAQATSGFGFFADLPASTFLLILLIFYFRHDGLGNHNDYSGPPRWSPLPIPLLNCSFLK